MNPVGSRWRRRCTAAACGALALLCGACSVFSEPKVGLIGDSITALAEGSLRDALDPGYDLDVVAKFGATSDQVLAEVELIAAAEPAQAIINIGTNDALQRIPGDRTRASVDAMVAELAGADCVFLVEINEAITADGAPRAAEARAVNDQLRQVAATAGNVELLEWNEDVARNGGPGAVTFDTVHLTAEGSALLADRYRAALDSC